MRKDLLKIGKGKTNSIVGIIGGVVVIASLLHFRWVLYHGV